VHVSTPGRPTKPDLDPDVRRAALELPYAGWPSAGNPRAAAGPGDRSSPRGIRKVAQAAVELLDRREQLGHIRYVSADPRS
jgi:hypothetical protein